MSDRLRLLLLEPSALVAGGAIALLRLTRALDKTAFQPLVVLGSEGPLVEEFRRIGVPALCLPFPSALSGVTRFDALRGGIANVKGATAYGWRLRQIAGWWQADIVHSNGLKMHFLSAFSRYGSRRVLVWHVRDLLCPPYMSLTTAFLARAMAMFIPDVVICNSETTRTALVGLSSMRRRGSQRMVSARSRSVHAVHDGVDCRAYEQSESPSGRSAKRRVLMLGRIAEWKGQHVFVKAAERICRQDDRTEFVIAGGATTTADAAYEQSLRGWIESRGLSHRIVLAGVVRDVVSLLESVDVLVHCSISPEPFGQVIIEGMAAGVPVVATDKGGPAEIIEDGVTGRLYPAGDDEALAAILRQLLDDPGTRQKLGATGARVAAERFGIERTAARVAEIYRAYAPVRASAGGRAPAPAEGYPGN